MIKIDKDIFKSNTLPAKFYSQDNYFEESRINIFEKSWQIICSENDLLNTKVYPFTYMDSFIGENLVITRSDDGWIRCISNVCTHRGHVIATCQSNTDILQCGYHGRTFDLIGKLKNAPGFENAKDFPTTNDDLVNIPIFNWNNFLLISLDPNDQIEVILSQIDQILPKFPYHQLSKPILYEYIIDCHWALYCDNYLEGFHIPHVHKGLNNNIDWKAYETKILDKIILQIAKSKTSDNSINYNDEKNIYAYYFFIFPNIMINYYQWGISINIIEPISKVKTRIKYMVYPIKGNEIPQNSASSLDVVELEDQKVILSVQKGIASRYYNVGRFSPKMEKGVHYFHRLISKKILNS